MVRFLILILFLGFPINVWSQVFIELTEKPTPTNLYQEALSQIKKNNQSALVFNSLLPLEYKSSNEILNPPVILGNNQLLIVTAGSSAITILFEGSPTVLNFGQLMGETKPSLKENEVKFFEVSLQTELEIRDITESEIRRGNNVLPISPNVSDAIVTLRVFPSDLELKIEEENNQISKISKDGNEYIVHLLTTNSNKKILKISASNGQESSIPIYELIAKDTRYFRISKPILSNVISRTSEDFRSIENIESLTSLLGTWSGTLGNSISHLKIFDPNQNDNTIKAELFQEGIYYSYEGNYNINKNNKINISFNKKLNKLFDFEKTTLELEYFNNIISGALINNFDEASDLTMLKSATIPPNNNLLIEEKLTDLGNKLKFIWNADDDILSEIYIAGIDYRNSIFGTLTTKYGKCPFNTKIKGSGINISFTIKTKRFCQSLDYDIIINIGDSSTVTMIDNSTGDFRNVRLLKNSNTYSNSINPASNNISDLTIDARYIVNTERTYFYSEPNLNTVRKAYLIRGQIPEVLSQDGEFYYVIYNHLEKTTTGFIKKQDLLNVNVKSFFSNTSWIGKYENNQITFVFTDFEKNLNNEYEIKGYNQIGKVKKLFRGKINSVYPNGLNVVLIEYQTDTEGEVFNINLNHNGQAFGSLSEKYNNSIRTFYLKKQ